MTQDITTFVRAWLDEPVQLPEAPGIARVAELVHDTRQQLWRSPFSAISGRLWQPSIQAASDPPSTVMATTQSLFSLTRFAAAAAIVALFGGFLLVSQSFDRVVVTEPGTETEARGLAPVTGPAGNGLIAFAHAGDIYLGDPVTGESEAIVAEPEFDVDPAFSPDGSRLAFTRCQEGYGKEDREAGRHCSSSLLVVRPDGSDQRVIATAAGDFLWAPDGQSLVSPSPEYRALTLHDASGMAAPRTVTLPTLDLGWGGPPFAGYSHVATFMRPPLGDRILAYTIDERPKYLDVMDADGSPAIRLIDEAWLTDHGFELVSYGHGGLGPPSWSPDGSQIAFPVVADGQDRVVVIDADGSDARVIGGGSSAEWSPDGTRILSQRWCDTVNDCGASLIIIDLATGTEREVASVTDLGGSWWSPDGTSILYTSGEQGRMHTVDVETGEVTDLPWESESWHPGPSWQRLAAD